MPSSNPRSLRLAPARLCLQYLLILLLAWGNVAALAQRPAGDVTTASDSNGAPGVVRLRQSTTTAPVDERAAPPQGAAPLPPYVPGEFERFVQKLAGSNTEVRRLGAELMVGWADGRSAELSPVVPPEYLVGIGDEVLVTLWGSLEADLRLTVDRGGRISIPRVGTVQVAGTRFGDLQALIARRVGQTFKNFEISVSVGQLRGIRIFISGFVERPGAYTVGSMSTVAGALMAAGGPASSGSFRAIELRRGGQLVANFDLYELLTRGDRSTDIPLQAGDVVHVKAVGAQVGVVGSVNKASVVELLPGESVSDALRFAGGFSAVADRTRLAIERLKERTGMRVTQLELPRDLATPLDPGDVVRAFSAVDISLPTQRQNKRVRIEGEVMRPAEYVLPEGSSVSDLIRVAGGYTPAAFIYATEFTRVSVQLTQQENYTRALRDLETSLARASSSQRVSGGDEAAGRASQNASFSQLIERLRALRPTGRIVLQLDPGSRELPDLSLEDGDRIYVPARPTTIGVFGSVYNAATYLHVPDRRIADYLRLAGGPTKGADEQSIFLVRANGSVISGRQRSAGWFSSRGGLDDLQAEPGDTVFVPEELDKTTFVQNLKDWSQILSQFGLGLAAIKVLGN